MLSVVLFICGMLLLLAGLLHLLFLDQLVLPDLLVRLVLRVLAVQQVQLEPLVLPLT